MYLPPAPIPETSNQVRYVAIKLLEMIESHTLNEKDVQGLSIYLTKLADELEVSK